MPVKSIGRQVDGNSYHVLARYYDRLMDEVDYDAWCDYVLDIVGRVQSRGARIAGGRILDLACGTGEFAYRLCQRGFQVTAIDISPAMLAMAEAKARSHDVAVELLQQDMRTFEVFDEYDIVFCLCDSMNYLLYPADWLTTFQRVFEVLSPRGLFVFDVNTPHKLATVYGDQTYAADQGDFAYIWENDYDPDTSICHMELTFFVQEHKRTGTSSYEKLTETHVQKGLSPKAIIELVRYAGFELLGQYGDLTYNMPNDTSERITFLCAKSC